MMSPMKKLLAIVVLGFLWFNAVVADISEFKIEGMSIKESLLNFMTEKDIDQSKKTFYPQGKKFIMIQSNKISNFEYDKVFLTFKRDDKNYIIHEIKAVLDVVNLTDCLLQRNELIKEIKELLKEQFLKREVERSSYEFRLTEDKTKKSLVNSVNFELKDGIIKAYCEFIGLEYKIQTGLPSYLSIIISTKEFDNWILPRWEN